MNNPAVSWRLIATRPLMAVERDVLRRPPCSARLPGSRARSIRWSSGRFAEALSEKKSDSSGRIPERHGSVEDDSVVLDAPVPAHLRVPSGAEANLRQSMP